MTAYSSPSTSNLSRFIFLWPSLLRIVLRRYTGHSTDCLASVSALAIIVNETLFFTGSSNLRCAVIRSYAVGVEMKTRWLIVVSPPTLRRSEWGRLEATTAVVSRLPIQSAVRGVAIRVLGDSRPRATLAVLVL